MTKLPFNLATIVYIRCFVIVSWVKCNLKKLMDLENFCFILSSSCLFHCYSGSIENLWFKNSCFSCLLFLIMDKNVANNQWPYTKLCQGISLFIEGFDKLLCSSKMNWILLCLFSLIEIMAWLIFRGHESGGRGGFLVTNEV